jgi:hypothetical protein
MPSILFSGNSRKSKLASGNDAISFLKEAFPRKFPGIKTIPTTKTEIKSIIHSIEARNLSGYN